MPSGRMFVRFGNNLTKADRKLLGTLFYSAISDVKACPDIGKKYVKATIQWNTIFCKREHTNISALHRD